MNQINFYCFAAFTLLLALSLTCASTIVRHAKLLVWRRKLLESLQRRRRN